MSMADKPMLKKAKQELEALYLGTPYESVDLTFKDLVSFQRTDEVERNATKMEGPTVNKDLTKSSSLDFSKALEGTKPHEQDSTKDELYREHLARNSFKRNGKGLSPLRVESSHAYSNASISNKLSPLEGKNGRKRPGIPHANICAFCNEYICFFRNRCLVCGRAYCRNCVGMGMGEMTEGRKCIECLGSRFSQRYIQRAGHTGCWWRYSSSVKQQELIWAEKGPQRSRGSRYDRSSIQSRSGSPVAMARIPTRSYVRPGTPNRSHANDNSWHNSMVVGSDFLPNPRNFPF